MNDTTNDDNNDANISELDDNSLDNNDKSNVDFNNQDNLNCEDNYYKNDKLIRPAHLSNFSIKII